MQATGRMPLARAPANNAVQRGEPDWYLSALQAGMRRVPAGLAPLETHPESPSATMRSSFGGPNCGVEEWQEN